MQYHINKQDILKPSTQCLIGANVITIASVFLFDYRVFDILVLFWLETAIIGFYALLKFWTVNLKENSTITALTYSIPLTIFFIFHFGIFMMVHLVFISVLFSNVAVEDGFSNIRIDIMGFVSKLILPLGALFISHGFSFIVNFLYKGEYKTYDEGMLMVQPYKRVVVMHLTIIFSGFVILPFGSGVAVVILSLIKFIIDINAHIWEHGQVSLNNGGVNIKIN